MEQVRRWPSEGRHILAQYDETTIVVYQAYKPAIGRFAVGHGCFGGPFRFNRMSWIKTNFLWMMFRSGWGSKPDQETILAIHIRRSGFDSLLEQAVHSTWNPVLHPSLEEWQKDLWKSEVRLQWNPDHDPFGRPVKRRAVQLGLRGKHWFAMLGIGLWKLKISQNLSKHRRYMWIKASWINWKLRRRLYIFRNLSKQG